MSTNRIAQKLQKLINISPMNSTADLACKGKLPDDENRSNLGLEKHQQQFLGTALADRTNLIRTAHHAPSNGNSASIQSIQYLKDGTTQDDRVSSNTQGGYQTRHQERSQSPSYTLPSLKKEISQLDEEILNLQTSLKEALLKKSSQ